MCLFPSVIICDVPESEGERERPVLHAKIMSSVYLIVVAIELTNVGLGQPIEPALPIIDFPKIAFRRVDVGLVVDFILAGPEVLFAKRKKRQE